ncbi:MAG TPA: cyclopropane fatty acyl phospholipid synthase [Candidatus Saccharimonadia bacterium]|nr:cyclopropane fatty acyl phospholipid synthase [Candidatus Saccharimonadia bacterium]
MADSYRFQVERLLKPAGIKINGKNAWDIQVHDDRLYRRALSQGSLGVGEAYMDGWWDAKDLEQLFQRAFRLNLEISIRNKLQLAKSVAIAKLINTQSIARSLKNVKHHYDIGNDLYKTMLGSTMVYSCGYWDGARTLDDAQNAKLDLICKKLKLKPGMRVLDIGCGWGSFVHYAAKHYGVSCVGNTLSKEQASYARQLVKGQKVDILVKDYRQLKLKPFDRIVSIGMFEHVGPANYRVFMKTCEHLLKDDGILLLHTIGANSPSDGNDPWIDKYIFPGGVLPSIKGIADSFTGVFIMEDWHNFGPDYAKTLRAWWKNFNSGYKALDKDRYDERFYRMWKFYLLACAANFTTRGIQLWQIVLSKRAAELEYRSIR